MKKSKVFASVYAQALRIPFVMSIYVVIIAVIIGLSILNPLWANLSPPFPILRVFPSITAPVDGPYYVQNAIHGYTWDVRQPLSLWYHPFMSTLISILPSWLPAHLWFWLLSLAFSVGAVILSYHIIILYSGHDHFPASLLFLILLIPGGLSIATGNPEIPTLFFASLLLLSVITWQRLWITIPTSILAILTKPNALYLIPMLCVYTIAGYREKDSKVLYHSILGCTFILLGWFFWILLVGFNAHDIDAYWQARASFAKFVAGDPASYFLELVRSWVYGTDLRDRIRYSTALIIPLVNMWIIAYTPFSRNSDRYALAAGNLTMLALVLWQGNPNKVIVYTTTIPGYFSLFVMFTASLMKSSQYTNRIEFFIIKSIYFFYIIAMIVVYSLGTPLGWYY